MRIIIVGLGVQGNKRRTVAGSDFVASVDPLNPAADFKSISDVPLSDYDAACVCTPDDNKFEIISYLLENQKHVLVEKPLFAKTPDELRHLERLARQQKVVLYTAYNHRFEPHFVKMRDLISQGTLGRIYHCRLFYGNGTARLVRNSLWRDQGAGVLPDLGSHLLDTINFWFGTQSDAFEMVSSQRFENKAPDHVVVRNAETSPQLEFEMTLLSWRNHFTCDVYAERGSAHISSLCKWGPSSFTLRMRQFPSGVPTEDVNTLVQADPTWAEEYAHFKALCVNDHQTDLSRDVWINQELNKLGTVISKDAATVC